MPNPPREMFHSDEGLQSYMKLYQNHQVYRHSSGNL